MKLVLAGGSGQVGTLLARAFHAGGHEVVVLGRRPAPAPWRTEAWDAATLGPWARELDGADVVVGLAGRSVNCRYTAENRRLILGSRVRSTEALGAALARAARPPRVWLQASTATIYDPADAVPNDEATGRIGGLAGHPWGFSVEVAQAWERAAARACPPATRLVLLRTSMVMSPDRGGIFDTLLGLVRRGLGGTSGSGRQAVSWIHEADVVGAVSWLVGRDDVSGPVNVTAPGPLSNRDFMRELRRAWGARVGLPAARWMLEVGAFAMRTETELVLKSRHVVPRRLLEGGYAFRYPAWPEAADELCARWRAWHMGAR